MEYQVASLAVVVGVFVLVAAMALVAVFGVRVRDESDDPTADPTDPADPPGEDRSRN